MYSKHLNQYSRELLRSKVSSGVICETRMNSVNMFLGSGSLELIELAPSTYGQS